MASAVALSCDDIRSLLAERLKGRPTRANFRTGHLTVCTLVPMRSIPHRVVCLLGLDDGSFPRHIERDGDDLTARDQRVGDRDARSEDRQLLLDALLAAQDHLVVTYAGRDERSNLRRPPAVPVGELLDVVEHTVRTPTGRVRDAIVFEHPLQPFDKRNFERDAAGAGPAVEFRRTPPRRRPRRPGPASRGAALPRRPLEPAVSGPIGLDQLERFLVTLCGRSSASGSTSGSATGPGTSRTPSPSISTGWSSGRSPTACCRSNCRFRPRRLPGRRAGAWRAAARPAGRRRTERIAAPLADLSPRGSTPCPRCRWTPMWTCPPGAASSAPCAGVRGDVVTP